MSLKSIWLLAAGIIIAANAYALKPWDIYEYPDAGFKCAFPNKPELTKIEGKKDAGDVYKAYAKLESFEYVITATRVSLCDDIPTTAAYFKEFTTNYTVRDKDDFTAGGQRGISAQIITDKGRHICYRVVVAEGMIYEQSVTSRSFLNATTLRKYHNYFELMTPKEDWLSEQYADAGFKALFPKKPTMVKEEGDNNMSYTVKAKACNYTYSVIATVKADAIGSPETAAAEAFKLFAEGAEVKEKKEFTAGSLKGVEGQLISKKKAYIRYRTFAIGKVHYQVMVIATNKDFPPPAWVTKFFKSFVPLK
jgi:hypothetical protein